MDGTEKASYLIFGRGHDPNRLRLGNLVMFPHGPDESDPYICPYTQADLQEWTEKAMEEPKLTIKRTDSNDKGALVKLTSLIGGDVSRSKGSSLTVQGTNARRFQIHQPTEFLNSVILSSPEAKKWLCSRIRVSKNMLLYTQLMTVGKKRHPQIWMVTGIQMLSDATVSSGRTGSAKTSANMQAPTPEVTSAVLAAVKSDGKLAEAEISSSTEGSTNVEYQHKDERVWAAQFRRLKLDFVDGDVAQAEAAEWHVSLDELVHLGLTGMKGYPQASDETRHITGVSNEDVAREDGNTMTEEEVKTFEKLRVASGKHALLIGGREWLLNGVRTDLRVMADLLIGRGFNISLCYGSDATRRGILREWNALIKRIPKRSRDAVVVYYSGHGGASESEHSSEAYRIQYLIPFDIDETTAGDFRGILDVELSHMVNQLTDRTHNVTIITDCCHSERIARQPPTPGKRTYLPPSVTRGIIDRHVRQLRAAGLHRQLNIEGNRYAVRLVAAESDKGAFEGETPYDMVNRSLASGGSKMGRLTRELVLELNSIGEGITSWDAVLPQLRLKLKEGNFQRPTIEGPRTRVLFSLDRLDYWGKLRVTGGHNNNNVTLMGGGVLAGVQVDDEYAIMPRTALSPDPAAQIGVARVKDVWQTKAVADLKYLRGHHRLTNGAVAFPLRQPRPRYGVAIQTRDANLATYIEKRLRPAFSVVNQHQYPFATIKHGGDKLVLIHRKTQPTLEYPMATAFARGEAVSDLILQLEKLVRADQLLTLEPKHPVDKLDQSLVSVGIGLVQDGHAKGKCEEPCVPEGESTYLIIKSNGDTTLYASVFLVTSMGNIVWLSHGHPSGAEIPVGHEYVPGQQTHGPQRVSGQRVLGQRHIWPESVPRTGHLDESYVVVLTSGKADLGFWENFRRTTDRGAAREYLDGAGDNVVDSVDNIQFCVISKGFKLVPR